MKIVKVNMFSNKVIYCTEHDKKDNLPPQKQRAVQPTQPVNGRSATEP